MTRYKAAKAGCATEATGKDRNACRKAERLLLKQKKRACKVAYKDDCRPCCAGEDATACAVRPDWTPEERATIEGIVDSAGNLEPLDDDRHDVTEEGEVREGDFKYVYEKHDVVDNIESIYYLGLNDDVIWPGNLVEGTAAHDFVYRPISIERAPVTLSISLEGSPSTGEGLVQVVDSPRLSTIRQGISNLLKKAITEDTRVPAKVEFNYEQVYNKSQMDLFLGVDVSYGAGSLETRFDWSASSETNKVLVKYKQIYYSIDIDTPDSPADIFSATLRTDDVAAAVPPGSMPLYIASVSYGLMAIMCIETNFNAEEMGLALDAAYSGVVDVDLGFGYTAEQVLRRSSIQIVVYGGSTAGLDQLELGFEGFMAVVGASKDFNNESPGVPLVYKFRHLSDNTLALITLFSQYTLVRPVQVKQRIKFTVVRFVCTLSDDEGPGNNADMDRFKLWINAYNRTDPNHIPGDQINIPDDEYGTVVYEWGTAGELTVGVGYIFDEGMPTSVIVEFDTEHYDFDLARIDMIGYHREYDTTSANEHGWGSKTIYGADFLTNGGEHSFNVNSADAGFEYEVRIELMSPNP